jgi:hypothetical protein
MLVQELAMALVKGLITTILAAKRAGKTVTFEAPLHPIASQSFVHLKQLDSEPVQTECVLDETRYKLLDNYRITLKAANENFADKHFYISELERLMREQPCTYIIRINGQHANQHLIPRR